MKERSKKLYVKNEGGNSHSHPHILNCGKRVYSWKRHTKEMKKEIEQEITHEGYHTKKKFKFGVCQGGYVFTPLFKYLLKQVGKDWGDVWNDVFPRVDGMKEPIQFMVANVGDDGFAYPIDKETLPSAFRYGKYDGNCVWSQLYVDDNNILQFVDKDYQPWIYYGGEWGQSFNGHPITKLEEKYKAEWGKKNHTPEEFAKERARLKECDKKLKMTDYQKDREKLKTLIDRKGKERSPLPVDELFEEEMEYEIEFEKLLEEEENK